MGVLMSCKMADATCTRSQDPTPSKATSTTSTSSVSSSRDYCLKMSQSKRVIQQQSCCMLWVRASFGILKALILAPFITLVVTVTAIAVYVLPLPIDLLYISYTLIRTPALGWVMTL